MIIEQSEQIIREVSKAFTGHAALRYHRFQHVQPPDESI